ncbi:hypothetical protein LUTEI9C_50204 [Luteimonas sp. 9C]|nr:hypothetical protein LUTEI9C_50204 [Luteimonas sp. 9C]
MRTRVEGVLGFRSRQATAGRSGLSPTHAGTAGNPDGATPSGGGFFEKNHTTSFGGQHGFT